MKTTWVVVVGGNVDLQKIIQNSACAAFPEATVTVLESVEEVLNRHGQKAIDLLVLVEPERGEVTRAAEATDSANLRFWPVVVMGKNPVVEGVESIPSMEWQPQLIARVFRSAVEKNLLRREILRLRGDMLTIGRRINHDLRTPLGCMLTAAEILQEMVAELAPSDTPLTRAIIDSADSLLKLIERVSFLAKASAIPLAKEPTDIGIALVSALQRLEWQALKQGVLIVQPSQWPKVAAVDSWLQVVWWNLVANSLQHGGPLSRIEVGWNRGEKEYRFWVTDDGQGVPVELRQLIFKPFHSLHEEDSGRGLGLSIVERLVELQGGSCGYEPLPERGSRFFFTLPDAKSETV